MTTSEVLYNENIHHFWFPARSYQTGYAKVFRNLPCGTIVMDRRMHELVHIFTAPPTRPPVSEMQRAIARHDNKKCSCYE